jgi:hypothetical protein
MTNNQNMSFKFNLNQQPHHLLPGGMQMGPSPHLMNHNHIGLHVHMHGNHPHFGGSMIPYPMDHPMMAYRYNHEMNDDSYSTDNMDNENDSESVHRHGSENMKHNKKLMNRCFNAQDNSNYERIIRKRKRKSTDQLKILMREFDRNPNWSKETLLEVSRKTGLSEAQVYKWGWD